MAQISLLVPPCGKLAEMTEVYLSQPIWSWKSKKEALGKVIAVIDDDTEDRQELELEASERPHIIRVKAGHHTLAVYDVDGDKKQMIKKALGSALTFGFAAMGGGLSAAADAVGEKVDRSNAKLEAAFVKDSCAEFNLTDTQNISFKCQVTAKGIVKLTLI